MKRKEAIILAYLLMNSILYACSPPNIKSGDQVLKASQIITASSTFEEPTLTSPPTSIPTKTPTLTTPPKPTPTPTLFPTQAGATIIGKILHMDEPAVSFVLPCLMVSTKECRVQPEWIVGVADEGSFEITGISPGRYTFFYGLDPVPDSRVIQEDKIVNLEDPVKIALSFDLDIDPVGCRHLKGTGKKDEDTGEYIQIITDTIQLEPLSLQIDFPGGFDWGILGYVDFLGPESGAALQVDAKENETVRITLMGIWCGD